jgi:hypothetical protein
MVGHKLVVCHVHDVRRRSPGDDGDSLVSRTRVCQSGGYVDPAVPALIQ